MSKSVQLVEGEVVSRVGFRPGCPARQPEKCPVKAAKCSCGSIGFAIYWLMPGEHLHLQCLECDESYCQAGECR